MNTQNRTSIFQLTAAMTIYGTLGLLRRYLPVPSALIALVRGVVGMGFLLVLTKVQGKRRNWQDIRANLGWLVLSGGALGLDWILLFETYRYTTVAAATLCYYTAPVMVVLASSVLFGEKISPRKGICAAASLLGMVFASGVLQPGSLGGTQTVGIVLGLLAAVLYAALILINRKLRHVDSYDRAIVQLGVASLVLIPYNLVTVDFGSIAFTPSVVILLLIAGVVHTGVAYALYFGSMAALSAQSVALMSYVDPIVAVLLSGLVLREPLSAGTVFGAIVVLGSMAISEVERSPRHTMRKTNRKILRAAVMRMQ